ncbi:hypothetical protein DFH27DRAFT_325148 [Peziza echinospora]|nr:hypothetical protein DFH27DRAFT_325148 [Peziza echinospora]
MLLEGSSEERGDGISFTGTGVYAIHMCHRSHLGMRRGYTLGARCYIIGQQLVTVFAFLFSLFSLIFSSFIALIGLPCLCVRVNISYFTLCNKLFSIVDALTITCVPAAAHALL